MKNFVKNIAALTLFLCCDSLHAQVAPVIEWEKSLGGYSEDAGYSVLEISSGGFIVAGPCGSADGDITGHHGLVGYYDYWIVKLDMDGNIVWEKSLGGTQQEFATCIQETGDGGFIVVGFANANGGDVSGNHGGDDYWIVKLDSDGNIEWEKSLGGSNEDMAYAVQQTTDEGYIVAGYSASNDGDVTDHHGCSNGFWGCLDYWVVKLDSYGDLVWQKSLGGSGDEKAFSIQQASDNGFIVAGYSESIDGDVTVNYGGRDYWIVKLDVEGNLLWQKSLGGSADEEARSVVQITGSGFALAGYSLSNDSDVSGNHGGFDEWVVKTDTDGNLIWQKCLGGTANEEAYCIQQTNDSGFVTAGFANSTNNNVSGNHGNQDYWVVKLDGAGNLIWQKCLGGSNWEQAESIQQTTDDGFIVSGECSSSDGDVTGHHGFWEDYWVVKLRFDTATGIASSATNSISVHPNPVQSQLNIDMVTAVIGANIRVYDLQGKMIALPITFTDSRAQLNTTSLADGFYTIQIVNNQTGEGKVGKFVKGK